MAAPPEAMAKRVGGTTGDQFIAQGEMLKRCIRHSLPPDYEFDGKRVLDFGCGAGRVLRHFQAEAGKAEFHGCDIHAPSIDYMRANYPIFTTFVNGEQPPLEVGSDVFDLVYAVSVFTHLPHSWEAWLLEMRRVLKPGGLLVATFLNKAAYENTLKAPFDRDRAGFMPEFLDRPWDRGGPNLYLGNDWVIDNWGGIFSIEALIDEGMMNWQSVALLRKTGEPPRAARPPVLRPFVYQDQVDRTITGNIEFNKFPGASWHEKHGMQVSGDQCQVRGWAVSKDAKIDRISFHVEGRELESSWEAAERKDVQQKLPDYTDSANSGFVARLDIAGLSVGRHELEVRLRDAAGREKSLRATLSKA